jgi:hypothetical protein
MYDLSSEIRIVGLIVGEETNTTARNQRFIAGELVRLLSPSELSSATNLNDN